MRRIIPIKKKIRGKMKNLTRYCIGEKFLKFPASDAPIGLDEIRLGNSLHWKVEKK